MNTEKWTMFTDGSCIDNPGGAGGWACVMISPSGNPIKLSGYNQSTTNQRMELTAVIEGLYFIPDNTHVDIYSDSAYVCNAINKNWLNNWINSNWVNSAKQPVANVDLWKLLKVVLLNHTTTFNWVKGHASNLLNNECDKMARDIIEFTNMIKDKKVI